MNALLNSLIKLLPSSGIGKLVAGALALVVGGGAVAVTNEDVRNEVTTSIGVGTPAATTDGTVDQANDYYRVVGAAQRDYAAVAGQISYCDLDAYSRATCAYGELTGDMRAAAKSRGRQDITVDPAGWSHNEKVIIPALTGVANAKDYKGYMYNRSHMIADSLGGDPSLVNLVTGTRGQNVGMNNKGGMAYTEEIARDYLDNKTAANSCPLYYAATPNYSGVELLPRTVTVDIQSCDLAINERVVVDNTANGYSINYVNGSFTKN